MVRARLNIYSYRSRCGKASSRHLLDRQHMRPRRQQGAIVATQYDVCHRLAVDLKVETKIPSEVCRPIDSEEARREVSIRPEVTRRTSSGSSADQNCAP